MRAKEAWVEKLKQDKLAHLLKVEAEKKAEEKRQEDEWLQLEAEKAAKELKEREEATKHKQLEDLDTKKEKKKDKDDKVNELALLAAGALSMSDRDSEMDLMDLKMAAMAKLKRRQKITKEKRKVDITEPHKCKFRSASIVENEEEGRDVSAGPLTLKHLKTEPAPQAQDKVFAGNSACLHRVSVLFH